MAAKKEVKFDDALAELETIIAKLEAGNLPLESAIELYKVGMTLSTDCHKKLQKIEAEIVKLVDSAGNVSDFDSESGA